MKILNLTQSNQGLLVLINNFLNKNEINMTDNGYPEVEGYSVEDESGTLRTRSSRSLSWKERLQNKEEYKTPQVILFGIIILILLFVILVRRDPLQPQVTTLQNTQKDTKVKYQIPDLVQNQNSVPSHMTRKEVLETIWHGIDPFKDFKYDPARVNITGWNSDHYFLATSIEEVRPNLLIEVGVWRGGSIITQGKALKENNIKGTIIAVDTWLGSWEHWLYYWDGVMIEQGYPTLHTTFMNNIINQGLSDYVVPLPIDSVNTFKLLDYYNITADIIHIDGEHTYNSVIKDLEMWWPKLNKGGIMIGDDYPYPDVRYAFDDFFAALNLPIEDGGQKCRIRKPK